MESLEAINIKKEGIFKNAKLNIFKVIKPKQNEVAEKCVNTRVALIYGKNGQGKTTFSNVIASMKSKNGICEMLDTENKLINLSEENLSNIYVYNEKFIDDNVKLNEEGLKAVIIFGEAVDIESKIKEKNIEKKEINDRIKISEEKIENYEKENDVNSYKFYEKKIYEKLKKDGAWATRDSLIKQNKNKTAVNMDTINIIMKKNREDCDEQLESKEERDENKLENEYKELEKIMSKNFENQDKNIPLLEKIDCGSIMEKKLKQLLLKTIEKQRLSERELRILDLVKNGHQSTYEKILSDLNNGEVNCPYCLRDMDKAYREGLIESIERIFNKEVNEYIKKLKEIKLPFGIEVLKEYEKYDKDEFEKISNLMNAYARIRTTFMSIVDYKINNVYEEIEASKLDELDVENTINAINDSIDKLNIKIININNLIKDKNNIRKRMHELNDELYALEIKEEYNLLWKFKKELELEKNEEKENVEKLEQLKKEIQELNAKKSSVYIALDRINEYMEYIFFKKDRLKLVCENNKYYVTVNGENVELKKLSTGERNIIALAYFFVTMFENVEEKDILKKDSLIVLDDPISSVDVDNKVGLYSFFRRMLYEIKNKSHSKIICLSHSLDVIYNMEKVFSDMGIGEISIKELKDCNLTEFRYKKYNEYSELIGDIFKYAKNEEVDELENTIGNTMRKVLEAYATFNYQKSIENITTNDEILEKIHGKHLKEYFRNFMYRLVLNGESHTQDKARSIVSISFYDRFSSDEKRHTAKSLIVLLGLIDIVHLKMYIKDKELTTLIKEWETEISNKGKISEST